MKHTKKGEMRDISGGSIPDIMLPRHKITLSIALHRCIYCSNFIINRRGREREGARLTGFMSS